MIGTVHLEPRGRILLALVDNPPVNALSHGVRVGLAEAIARLDSDAGLDAMVLACSGASFIAGADIREFGKPLLPPKLQEMVNVIEGGTKPVIAAIHGQALGGGFEVALACHFRVATPDAKLGLPEVKLGLLPGAGGTQRLPRLVDAKTALSLIVDAKQLAAKDAAALGVIDEIITGDLVTGALAFAERIVAETRPIRRSGALTPTPPDPAIFEEAERDAARKYRGQIAPRACIDMIRNAYALPIAEGMPIEYARCIELMGGAQSKALRAMFFNERAVTKVPALKDVTPRKVGKAGVVGPGVMGRGIAICFANVGIPVTLLGRTQKSVDAAMAGIAKTYAGMVTRGSLTEEKSAARLALITPATEYAALADTDLVIEAAIETRETKHAIFRALDAACKPGAILASNTSYLDIDEIAGVTSRPSDVAGMHFFVPAHLTGLIENVRATATAPDVQATLMDVTKRLGKTGVLVGACEGFVANRMLARRSREAAFLLEEGATPSQVDKALTDFGFPMGPFAVSDMGGLDVQHAVRQLRMPSLTKREQRTNPLDRLVALGRLGQKTNAGYYLYDDKRKASPDPKVDEIVADLAASNGITRRTITDQEIVERCIFAMVNEGARLLEQGVVTRPHEIDVIWVHALAFPRYRGGPMFYADSLGLGQVRDAMRRYADTVGPEYFTPAPLIEKLAAEGRGFYDMTGG